jgi:hypothetical protein
MYLGYLEEFVPNYKEFVLHTHICHTLCILIERVILSIWTITLTYHMDLPSRYILRAIGLHGVINKNRNQFYNCQVSC